MTVTITNRLNGTLESLAANTSGTSITANYNSTTGELTLTGRGHCRQLPASTAEHHVQQQQRITEYNRAQITIQAADAFVQSNIATATINITAVNDALFSITAAT